VRGGELDEAGLLARAGELPDAREVAGERFAPLVASPLLIRRVRGPGGSGGRRVTAGVLLGDPAAYAVLVEGSGRAPSLRAFCGAQACADAFAGELASAARDGLGSRPEPARLSAEELVSAGAALLA
jgi:hypothetical protein